MTAYDPGDFYDEALEPSGEPRAHYREGMAALEGADLGAVAAAIVEDAEARGVKYGDGRFVIDAVLSDGPANDAWYEQREIGRRLHVPLATPADLELRSGASTSARSRCSARCRRSISAMTRPSSRRSSASTSWCSSRARVPAARAS